MDSTVVCSLVKRLYPFQDVDKTSVKQLPGYEDRNFYFKGHLEDDFASYSEITSQEFVFKVSHTSNSRELLEGVNEVMDHLCRKGFLCSFAISNRFGKKIAMLSDNQLSRGDPWVRTGGRCAQYPVRVLIYVPGETLDPTQVTPEQAFHIGRLAGSIDKALLVRGWSLRSFVMHAQALWLC